jgi:hypothetical protein
VALLAADAPAAAALRGTCRAARDAVDASLPALSLRGAPAAAALPARAPRLAGVRALTFCVSAGEPDVLALAAALPSLPRLAELAVRERGGVGACYIPTPGWAARLAAAAAGLPLLERLEVSLVSSHPACAASLLAAAAALPRLRALSLPWSWAAGSAGELAAGRWPELRVGAGRARLGRAGSVPTRTWGEGKGDWRGAARPRGACPAPLPPSPVPARPFFAPPDPCAPPSQQELTLRGLGDAEIAALAALELPSLTSLRLAGSPLAAAACGALAAAPWWGRLRALSLNDCGLGAAEARALFCGGPGRGGAEAAAAGGGAEAAQAGGGAEAAQAGGGCGGGGGGCVAARLEDLSLRGNRLRDDGAAALASAPLPSLRRLCLASNHAGARGVGALARARWAAALEELDLGSNPLVLDSGVAALAAAPLPLLRRVGLVHTGLSDDALPLLAAAPWMCGVTELGLAYNKALGRRADAWAALAARPLRVRRLDLRAATALGAEAEAALGGAAWLAGVEELLVGGVNLCALSALKRSPCFLKLEARGAVRLRA